MEGSADEVADVGSGSLLKQAKIAQVVESSSHQGGTQAYLASLNSELNARGCPSSLISRSGFRETESFLRQVRRTSPDVICLHSVFEPNVAGALASLAPTLAWVHDYASVCPGYEKYFRRSGAACEIGSGWQCIRPIYQERCSDALWPHRVLGALRRVKMQKRSLHYAEKTIVASRHMRKVLLSNGFDPVGVDVVPLYPVCPVLKGDSLPGKDFVLFAGRLEREKGCGELLEAFSRTSAELRLEIAGEGTQQARCRRRARELGISDRVRFLGWLDGKAMDRKLRQCRFLVMPSIWPEPFGIVGIEALVRGKPVIAFDVGGIGEWLKDGRCGVLVEPHQPERLARHMESLWTNSHEARRLGEQGREFVQEHFNKEAHMTRVCTLLNDLTASRIPG